LNNKETKFISRNRYPTVRTTYPVPLFKGDVEHELPFVVGVFSNLSGNVVSTKYNLKRCRFCTVEVDTFDCYLSEVNPQLDLTIRNVVAEKDESLVQLSFYCLDDFLPSSIYRAILKSKDVLSEIERAKTEPNTSIVSRLVNQVLHNSEFQRLESAWRGLHYLVSIAKPDVAVNVRVMDLSKRDMEKFCSEGIAQSQLFKILYEEANITLGGTPFSCLLGDYYFDGSVSDTQTLSGIAEVASKFHAPFIAGASPGIMQLEFWNQMSVPLDHQEHSSKQCSSWRELRESEDALYLCLTLPRFMGRLPFTRLPVTVGGQFVGEVSEYDEADGVQDFNNHLWLNSAFAMVANVCRCFKESGWFSNIAGLYGGGLVECVPQHAVSQQNRDTTKVVTEAVLGELTEKYLVDRGFSPLANRPNTDSTVFYSTKTLHYPKQLGEIDIDMDSILNGRLQYRLACCRFVHVLMVLNRDRAGMIGNIFVLQTLMQKWIDQYVNNDPYTKGAQLIRTQKPLSSATVSLSLNTDTPDRCHVKLAITPRYLLDGLTSPMIFNLEVPFEQTTTCG